MTIVGFQEIYVVFKRYDTELEVSLAIYIRT